MKVIEERLRRNCKSAVTRYSIRARDKRYKIVKENGLLDVCTIRSDITNANQTPKNNCHPRIHTNAIIKTKVPIFKQEDCFDNYLKNYDYNCVPLTTVLLENSNKKLPNIKEEKCEDVREITNNNRKEPPKWLGIDNVIESYRAYSKGMPFDIQLYLSSRFINVSITDRDVEMTTLQKRCKELQDEIRMKQGESRSLEKKHRELHLKSFHYNQEYTQLKKNYENLTNIIKAFR